MDVKAVLTKLLVPFGGLVALLFYRYIVRLLHLRRCRKALESAQKWKRGEQARNFGLADLSPESVSLAPLKTDQVILSLTIANLTSKLKAGSISCEEALLAFARQAVRLHKEYNCLSEVFIHEAIQRAKELDQKSSPDSRRGPLFGVPVSLKDTVSVKGYDSTLGTVRYTKQPLAQDSLIVELLRRAGAIPFVKTNVPQTMLSFECKNPLFGRTLNPWNKKYTPGGSSGGESCLIVGRGSPCGIGTDIGGSLRIPAHMAGICALKPTNRRVTKQLFRASVPGQEAVPGICGPMGRTVDDLALLMAALCVEYAWKNDSTLVPLPFDQKQYQNDEKLRIGYYIDDGLVPASPACSRAVLEVVESLKEDGHTVVPFEPNALEGILLWYNLVAADAGATVTGQLIEDVWEDYTSASVSRLKTPAFLRKLIIKAFQTIIPGGEKGAHIIGAYTPSTVTQLWALQAKQAAYRAKFHSSWRAQNLDVIISPVHVLPATPHDSFKEISFACSYTMLANTLDFPAGVVPVTVVKPSDAYKTEYKSNNYLEKQCLKYYNANEMAGLPVGVQVTGLPFEEERVLRAMRIISKLIPFNHKPEVASWSDHES